MNAMPDPAVNAATTAAAARQDTTPDDDPMPQPPVAPALEDCCGNGCDPCIFDAHDLAMDAYRQALRAWQARHPQA